MNNSTELRISILIFLILKFRVGWAKGLYPVPIKCDTHEDGHVVPPLPILQNCFVIFATYLFLSSA